MHTIVRDRASRWCQLLIASAASMMLLVTACSSSKSADSGGASNGASSAASSSADVELGAVVAKTGAFGTYGAADALGMQAQIKLVNGSGGVLGHKLKLNILDDGSDPTKAAVAATQLLSAKTKPLAMWAGAVPTDSAAVLGVTSHEKVITFEASNAPLTKTLDHYNYDLFPLAENQNSAFVSAIETAFGGKPKVGILATSDASGVAAVAADKTALADGGLTLVATQEVAPTATDMSSQLQKLRSSGAEVVLTNFNNPTLYVLCMDNIKAIGWSTVKVIGSTAAVTATVLAGVPMTNPPNFAALGTSPIVRESGKSSLSPRLQTFTEAFKSVGGDTNALLEGLDGGDAVNLIVWAIKKANSIDPEKVNAVLENLAQDPISASELYQVPPPAFSSTVHDLAGADFSNYWALVYPGTPIDGTYPGKKITL